MGFKHNWDAYKKNKDIKKMFFLHNNVITKKLLLLEYNLDFAKDYDKEEGQFSLVGNKEYPIDVNHIYNISVEDHGLFTTKDYDDYSLGSIDDYIAHAEKNESPIEAKFNDSILFNPILNMNNIKQEIALEVELKGEQRDLHLIYEWGYFMIAQVEVMNSDTSYSNRLILEGWDLYRENKWDLCLLVFYSAIENLITLEAEKLQEKYYKEINIMALEFKSKVSLVLKESAEVDFDKQNFAALSYIIKEISSLYKLRNNVAHGNVREITEENCNDCFELYLFIVTLVEKGSISIDDMIKDVKTLIESV